MIDDAAKYLCDELREEGITARGYGTLPKFTMLDTDLTLEAKGIYAYFCSYRGAGNCAFPGYRKIISDLKINKDTYYKHLRMLIDNGYLKVSKQPTSKPGFMKNVYVIVMHPPKFESVPQQEYLKKTYSLIRTGDLEDAGRGVVPKTVVTDHRLSLKAKALYAYFCAFAGSGNSACPKKEYIMNHLGISRNSLDKYLGELKALNYLTVVQRHVNGLLSVNDYVLNRNPDIDKAVTCHTVDVVDQMPKISEACNLENKNQVPNFSEVLDCFSGYQVPKNQEARNQELQNQESQISEAKKNNSKNKNNLLSSTADNHRRNGADRLRTQREEFLKKCGIKTKGYSSLQIQRQDEFLGKIADSQPLNIAIGKDKRSVRAAIEILTEDDSFGLNENYDLFENGQLQFSCFCLYRDALIELLLPQSTYRNEMLILLEENISPGYPVIMGLYDTILPIFSDINRVNEIKTPDSYMKRCILNALRAGIKQEEGEFSI